MANNTNEAVPSRLIELIMSNIARPSRWPNFLGASTTYHRHRRAVNGTFGHLGTFGDSELRDESL
jgi:hypothetical protein